MKTFRRIRSWGLALIYAALAVGCGSSTGINPGSGGGGLSANAQVGHVFIIILENEDYDASFGGTAAPYLAQTLPAQGALLKQYYSTGHASNDNYISMVSGQPPNIENQLDCVLFDDFLGLPPTSLTDGVAVGQGCVFPTSVQTVADQLSAAGYTWKGYMEDMGNTPSRESATCGHPAVGSVDKTQSATAADQYATRHDPFVYFHTVIDSPACDTNVVSLKPLAGDLSSIATTANYTFITPNLCHDGHDSPCADGEPGGLTSANAFLKQWVPQILNSPAYQQDGLLIITFDEAFTSDASACCGETDPNSPLPGEEGQGGGVIGAVLISPFITPGTVSTTAYNHYSLLHTVEDLFGLSYLGYAGASSQLSFGRDVFTAQMPVLPAKN